MEARQLKNYGRPYSETMPALPAPLRKRLRRQSARVLLEELGWWGMLRLLILIPIEKRRLKRVDLDSVRARGLNSESFIDLIVDRTAVFAATARLVGMERAREIHRRIAEQVSGPVNRELLPRGEEFEGVEDLFAAFRSYMLAFFEAERAAGLHEYSVIENSDDAVAINVSYCAFCEIPKTLGLVEACDSGCHADEVFFPGFLAPFGLRFVRTQTLARGGDHCDFRFERRRD